MFTTNKQTSQHLPIENTVDKMMELTDSLRKITLEVGGTGVLLFLDVVLGAVSLSMTMANDSEVMGMTISASVIATLISIATSAIQIVLWRAVFELGGVYKILSFGPAVALMLLDTISDSALSAWIIYGVKPIDFPPANPSYMYWAVWGIMTIVTGFNEPLVEMILSRRKEQKPAFETTPVYRHHPRSVPQTERGRESLQKTETRR